MDALERAIWLESLVYHAAWLAPLVISAAAAIRILMSSRTTVLKIHGSFLWAFVVIAAGYGGVYVSWRLLAAQVGLGSDIPFDLFLVGLRNSLLPAASGLMGAAALLIIATWISQRDAVLRDLRSAEDAEQIGANGT